MVNYREILRLRPLFSQREIAQSVHSSRDTIREVYTLADERGLAWPLPEELTNEDIRNMLYPQSKFQLNRKTPDCQYMHQELARPGVTLTLLWSEYCEQCNATGLIPYQYTQFCEFYRKYVRSTRATMRIKRKPGEILETDWAGSTLTVSDSITGEANTAYVFVAALACSQYSYAEAFTSMATENWINAHVHAYGYFGGATRIVTPDNLKTGIIKNTRYEVIANRSYQEMAEHYGTAIIPARVRKPKDKPNAEGTVGVISTWIIAALRNEKFFTFEELNKAIREKLDKFNAEPFQKKEGSRFSAFVNEEKPFLLPLPASAYEMAVWATATIQADYLITVGNVKYSVPFDLIGQKVDIRYTSKTVEVFFHGNRMASHIRRHGVVDPIVIPEHMPENHRRYLEQGKDTYLKWASGVGPATETVMKAILGAHKVEQQSYRACGSLMKLSDRYSVARIEYACSRALQYTPSPSIKNIQTILKTGQDKVKPEKSIPTVSGKYGFTRGADYFGGGDQND